MIENFPYMRKPLDEAKAAAERDEHTISNKKVPPTEW